MPRLEMLEDRSLPSTFTVTNVDDHGPHSLRAAIASGDATIDFAGAASSGTILLTRGELLIDHNVTINGPGASVNGNSTYRVFEIGNGATVTIDKLAIANGQTVGGDGQSDSGYGGGILIDAGATLNLDQVVMTNNQAMAGAGGSLGGVGGAIENLGSLTVSDSTFTNNKASLNSTFVQNLVGSNGGAIDSSGPSLTVNNSTFSNNQAVGTSTEDGSGNGGAIFSTGSTATVTNSAFNGNAATGRDDAGGAIDQAGGLMTISNSTFTSNQVVGANGANDITYGSGGEALGGAIINAAPLTITNSTFTDNLAKGGDGGDASSDGVVDYVPGVDGGRSQVGTATGGGVANFFSSLTVTNSTFTDNRAIGGNSAMGPGGDAAGGGIVSAGTNIGGAGLATTLTNVTFAGNQAIGGSGGSSGIFASIPYTGNGGRGFGGGLYSGIYSTATVSYALFLGNQAVGGAGGPGATGGDGAGGAFANGGGFGDPVVVLIGLGPDTSTLSVDHSTLIFNVAQGGAGGSGANGGNGLGGGAYNDGAATLTLTNDLVTLNLAVGGQGKGHGADGDGIGGGVYTLGAFTDPSTLIIFNFASTSGDNIWP